METDASLIKPKRKVGDKLQLRGTKIAIEITDVLPVGHYVIDTDADEGIQVSRIYQHKVYGHNVDGALIYASAKGIDNDEKWEVLNADG